jgi:hypothetical protein
LKEIVADILRKESPVSRSASMGGESIPLDKAGFRAIPDMSDDKRKVAFIDGGNNEIAASPHFALHLIRVFGVIYKGNRRIERKKYEFHCLATAEKREKGIVYSVKCYPINHSVAIPEFDAFDETLRVGNRKVSPSRICEAARRFAELDIAAEIAGGMSEGDIIVRDGDLTQEITHDGQFYDRLRKAADANGVIICGLSKTTDLATDDGYSLVSAIAGMAPDGIWYYPFEKYGISFAKLHPKSAYAFRIDCGTGHLDDVLPLLVENSRDPVFLGYPYGLIEADRHGRVSDAETGHARMRLKMAAGKDWKAIERSIRAGDAHSVLDNIG